MTGHSHSDQADKPVFQVSWPGLTAFVDRLHCSGSGEPPEKPWLFCESLIYCENMDTLRCIKEVAPFAEFVCLRTPTISWMPRGDR